MLGVRELLEGLGVLAAIIGFSVKLSRDLGMMEMKLNDLKDRVDRLQTLCDRRHNGGMAQ